MNTLLLHLNGQCVWSPEIWALERGGERGVGRQVVIEGSSGWLSVLRDDRVLDDYDDEERTILLAMLSEPTPFLVEWKGIGLLEVLLQAVPLECHAIIDNDHGVLVPIETIRDLPIESWVRASKLP